MRATRTPPRRLIAAQRPGQALVELALLVPVLLLLLGTVVEFGRLYQQSTLAAGAAREGARVAALGGKDADVATAVSAYASGLDKSALRVGVTPFTRISGQDVTVTVEVPVRLMVPVVTAVLGPVITVHGEAVMRVE